MAGLDTRGVFDGFAQGFGLVDNYLNNKAADERANRQQGMYERGLQMREQEFAAQQEDRQRTNDLDALKQNAAAMANGLDLQMTPENDALYKRNPWADVRNFSGANAGLQDEQGMRDRHQITQFYHDWASGSESPLTPELDQAFQRNPMADPRHLFDPKTEAAVQYADKLASGEGNLFSKETADHMHNFFRPRIDRMPGRSTRLVGVYPGQREGTLAFEVGVTPKGGLDGVDQKEYFAPVTVNRGIAGQDDEVAQHGIDQVIAPVMGAKQIYQGLGPENKARMLNYFRDLGLLPKEAEKWDRVAGPDGAIFLRNQHGDEKLLLGRESRLGLAGYGAYAPSSDVKTLQWLMAPEGGNLDAQAARNELVRMKRGGDDGGVSTSDRYRVSYLTDQIKEIDSQLQATTDAGIEADLKQQRQQLIGARNDLASQLGLTGTPGQTAKQRPQPAAIPQAGHIEDGYEFLGGDPANPESWRKK